VAYRRKVKARRIKWMHVTEYERRNSQIVPNTAEDSSKITLKECPSVFPW
jgi:hypothetical protein